MEALRECVETRNVPFEGYADRRILIRSLAPVLAVFGVLEVAQAFSTASPSRVFRNLCSPPRRCNVVNDKRNVEITTWQAVPDPTSAFPRGEKELEDVGEPRNLGSKGESCLFVKRGRSTRSVTRFRVYRHCAPVSETERRYQVAHLRSENEKKFACGARVPAKRI